MKRWMTAALLAAGLLGFFAGERVSADDASAASVEEKLERVLKNQERILAELETIKSELQIVKVRATLSG